MWPGHALILRTGEKCQVENGSITHHISWIHAILQINRQVRREFVRLSSGLNVLRRIPSGVEKVTQADLWGVENRSFSLTKMGGLHATFPSKLPRKGQMCLLKVPSWNLFETGPGQCFFGDVSFLRVSSCRFVRGQKSNRVRSPEN